jgi:hypothetical protein
MNFWCIIGLIASGTDMYGKFHEIDAVLLWNGGFLEMVP